MEKSQKSNFLIRTVSGIVLVLIVVGAIFFSPYTMMALWGFLCIGAIMEFYKIARKAGAQPLETYPALLGTLFVVMAFFWKVGDLGAVYFWAFLPAVFLLFIIELYRKKENPFANIGWTLAGLIYIAVPFALLAMMPVQELTGGKIYYQPMILIIILAVVWSNDVGAYLFGVTLGKHRLFERISPKKSWEGFFGGIICAVGVGVLIAYLLKASLWYWGGAALVLALAAVFGDLVESMLKRSVDLKDSGNLIPGHGGLLDRFDALLMAVPLIFVYFTIFAQ